MRPSYGQQSAGSNEAQRQKGMLSRAQRQNEGTEPSSAVLNPGGVERAKVRKRNPGQASGMEALDLPGTHPCRLPLKEGN